MSKNILDKTVIAFDPGGVTGYACLKNKRITLGTFKESTEVDKLIEPGSIVIYEKPFKSAIVDMIVFEVKGAIAERAYTKKCMIIAQVPHVAKHIQTAYESHQIIKPLYGGGAKKDHNQDAFDHLCYYLMNTHKLNFCDIVAMVDKEFLK